MVFCHCGIQTAVFEHRASIRIINLEMSFIAEIKNVISGTKQ